VSVFPCLIAGSPAQKERAGLQSENPNIEV
jgi:hypothetical protein